MENLADIGLIGLAVMGQNLALNISDHGYPRGRFQPHHVKSDALHRKRSGGPGHHRRLHA